MGQHDGLLRVQRAPELEFGQLEQSLGPVTHKTSTSALEQNLHVRSFYQKGIPGDVTPMYAYTVLTDLCLSSKSRSNFRQHNSFGGSDAACLRR